MLSARPPVRLSAQELVTARLTVRTPAALDTVRRLGIDVVEVRPAAAGLDLLAVIGPADQARLLARGFLAQLVPPGPDAAAQEAARARLGSAAFAVFRDFDDPVRGYAAWLRAFDAARANVTVDSIGATVEGRPLLLAKVGPAGTSASRPNVLFLATYHAREWAATEMARRLLEYLADSLPSTPAGAALLAARDVWVLPVANPDGYQYTFASTRLWRKNRRPNGDGSFGVDLNRNHDGFFGLDDLGSSGVTSTETYRGGAAESERETRAIADFHRANPPDVAITYHTYMGAVLYPWSHAPGLLTGDDPIFRALAGDALAPAVADGLPGSSRTRYYAGPGWQLYPTNGDYASWAYRAFGTVAVTAELTAGCCASGADYGFQFPDDEAMLAQVFRDNLPFALAMLQSAADLAHATGPAGRTVTGPAFEAVWPDVRVVLDPAITPLPPGGASPIEAALGPGVVRGLAARVDALDRGRVFTRVRSADSLASFAAAVRVGSGPAALVAELVAREGAESAASAWSGFARVPVSVEGQMSWFGRSATLSSPAIPVADPAGLVLYFWTRHEGSLFAPAQYGRAEVSGDNGVTWSVVYEAQGAAASWYPVAASLPLPPGATSLRVRFVSNQMDWWVDAIAVAASSSTLFAAPPAVQAPAIAVSQNPLRSGTVTLRWPAAAAGNARVEIFSLLGTPVVSVDAGADVGLWRWDGTILRAQQQAGGAPVANGAYLVVVTRGDGQRLRRRLIVAR